MYRPAPLDALVIEADADAVVPHHIVSNAHTPLEGAYDHD